LGDMTQEATYPREYLLEDTEPSQSQGPSPWGRLVGTNDAFPGKDLFEDTVTIGRRSTCTISVGHNHVSGSHCQISRKDDGDVVTICDTSRNGTTVRIHSEKQLLRKEERLLVDGTEIILVPRIKGISAQKISFKFFVMKQPHKILEGPEIKYDIREKLGSGAFAEVKLCVHRITGTKYAIKIVDKHKFKKKNHSSRPNALQDEVKILQEMNHDNIIKIIEVFETKDKLQLVLELVRGGDLFDCIINYYDKHQHGFSEDKAKSIFKQLIDAVEYMHDKKVAHRDLKPENILLRDKESDVVKISDFGLSRFVSEGSYLKTLCGTPMYLAPEVLPDSNGGISQYGFECDLWSLGAILYVMLSGCAPFDEEHPRGVNILTQVKKGMYDFPEDSFGHVSEAPKDLIKRLMTVDPRSRCTLQQVKAHEWMVGEWKQVPKDKKEEETKEEEEHITDGKKEENNSNGKDLATGADDEADDCKQQTTKIRKRRRGKTEEVDTTKEKRTRK